MKKTKSSILIIVLYLFYSLIGIIAKHNAMTSAPASISFFSLLALQLLCLFIFALGWQYILKISTLSKAYAFKGTVVLWGMLFARFKSISLAQSGYLQNILPSQSKNE